MLICPNCQSMLSIAGDRGVQCDCGRLFPRLGTGGFDFLEGQPFEDFELDPSNHGQTETLRLEAEGVAERLDRFLVPALQRYCVLTGRCATDVTILDCGCGGGLSVDLLREAGFQAWGIDAGRSRHRQWQDRSSAAFLHAADALRLPFDRASFDVVISCGLVEHIGIYEAIEGRYIARRLPDCHGRRRRFAEELLRVTRDDGFILLDHPNGSFPIDFWHGGFRMHLPWDDMLPRFLEVSRYFRSFEPDLGFLSLSPRDRLRLGRVQRLKFGRALAPLIRLWLRLLTVPFSSAAARSCLNPYLVTLIYRKGLDARVLRQSFA
ncbi:MAG: class I SAM-dependent methyltransferase [Acidobacteriota bacterium]